MALFCPYPFSSDRPNPTQGNFTFLDMAKVRLSHSLLTDHYTIAPTLEEAIDVELGTTYPFNIDSMILDGYCFTLWYNECRYQKYGSDLKIYGVDMHLSESEQDMFRDLISKREEIYMELSDLQRGVIFNARGFIAAIKDYEFPERAAFDFVGNIINQRR